MKRIFIMFAIMFSIASMSFGQQTIDKIRTHYNEMRSYVDQMATWDEEYPVPTFYHVKIQENYPGTGRHEEDVYIYHDIVEPVADDVIFPPKRISFVTSKYNFAARGFYEEYLYDEKGNIEFIYGFAEYDEEDKDWEYRFYFKDGKPIKCIVKNRGYVDGNADSKGFSVVYEGSSVSKKFENIYKGFLGKSKKFKTLFSAVADVQCY